jgi:magnesium-protoporphyrin IX monomethyl ester (oxidative) cyclase
MSAIPSMQSSDEVLQRARTEDLISPRFYTTDFEAMNRLDVSSRAPPSGTRCWPSTRATTTTTTSSATTPSRRRSARLDPALQREFLDFLVTSITSEFSGCVLYNEIRKKVDNPDIKQLMTYLHARRVPPRRTSST